MNLFYRLLSLACIIIVFTACFTKRKIEEHYLESTEKVVISDSVIHYIALEGNITIYEQPEGLNEFKKIESLDVPKDNLQDTSELWAQSYQYKNGMSKKYILNYYEKSIIVQVFRINKTLKTHGRYLLEINEIKKLNKNLSNRKTNSYTIVRN